MLEVIQDIDRWRVGNDVVGLATVVQTWGSAPRKAGGKMAITTAGEIAGSVSGGCVEGAVYEEAVAAIQAGQGKMLQFGVADETAWEVGLACGGNIRIFVEPLDMGIYDAVRTLIDEDRMGALATVIASPEAGLVGNKVVVNGNGRLTGWDDAEMISTAQTALRKGKTGRVELDNGSELFVEVYLPAPQLIMVGGVHIAVALADIAKVLGYRTVVVDPRRAFGSETRFADVDQLLQMWPEKAFAELTVNENTAVALLTHDPKIDDPALTQVLDGPAFYVGALGSRKTHAKRVTRLQAAGYSDETIGRIHGPIGLSLGAQTPEEIALSVMAQILQARRS